MLEKIPIRVRNALTDGLIGYISWTAASGINKKAASLLDQTTPLLAQARHLIDTQQFDLVDQLHNSADILLRQAEILNDATFLVLGLVYIASVVMLYNSIQFAREK